MLWARVWCLVFLTHSVEDQNIDHLPINRQRVILIDTQRSPVIPAFPKKEIKGGIEEQYRRKTDGGRVRAERDQGMGKVSRKGEKKV